MTGFDPSQTFDSAAPDLDSGHAGLIAGGRYAPKPVAQPKRALSGKLTLNWRWPVGHSTTIQASPLVAVTRRRTCQQSAKGAS
jgi:hypothetical protein